MAVDRTKSPRVPNVKGLRHIAPAGAPIGLGDLVQSVGLTVSSRDVAKSFRQTINRRFGVKHAFLTSTGRAGLTLLLRAMRHLAPATRDEVILPSYTCFSVAASIVKAGLRPRVVDICPDTLDYAPHRLSEADFTRVLAIVATNLYGLPNDLPGLSDVARRKGVFLIDDAAQSMGASVGGRWSGTWGDAGLFSFDKGKNVSAIDCGVVVSNSDAVASAVREELRKVATSGRVASGVGAAKAIAYALLLRPWLYWIPNGIPQLGLGKTVFTTDFPLQLPPRSLTALAATMVRRLDEFTAVRRANASTLLEALTNVPGVQPIRPTAGTEPVYLRLPILIADPVARDEALERLTAAGIGASGSYPASIGDIPELQTLFAGTADVATGRRVARQIVTLPTHAFVTASDVGRAVAALSGMRRNLPRAVALHT
jgi:perosamine synthetase